MWQEMVFHANQLDSLSHDLTRLSKGGLSHKPGSDSLAGRIIPSCLSTDDPKVTRKSVLFGMMPDKLSFNPEAMNSDVKHQIMKEIRQLGRSK